MTLSGFFPCPSSHEDMRGVNIEHPVPRFHYQLSRCACSRIPGLPSASSTQLATGSEVGFCVGCSNSQGFHLWSLSPS